MKIDIDHVAVELIVTEYIRQQHYLLDADIKNLKHPEDIEACTLDLNAFKRIFNFLTGDNL